MGCNFYLKKKSPVTFPASVGCDRHGGELIELTNGIVWNKTFYPNKEECDKVFRQEFHIGKSSTGWYFSLAIYPAYGINNFDDWKKLFADPQNEIYDECGRKISPREMINWIANRGYEGPGGSPEAIAAREEKDLETRNKMASKYHIGRTFKTYDEYMSYNGAERGIKGLWRHKKDKYTSHPEDPNCTYDYILSGNDPETGRIFS